MILGEYGLVLILAAAAITGMTIMFSRSIQARIYDARTYMQEPIKDYLPTKTLTVAIPGYSVGDEVPVREYEPYYTKRASVLEQSSKNTKALQSFGSTGIYSKSLDEKKDIKYIVNQLPPKDAK